MTGVNASCILPWYTSFPVVIIAAFLTTNGFISRIGPSSHMCEAASSLSFFMTSGMILVPASLSPFFTVVLPCLVAIIISPKELTFFSFSLSTLSSPSQSAITSILPSFTGDGCILLVVPPKTPDSAASQ